MAWFEADLDSLIRDDFVLRGCDEVPQNAQPAREVFSALNYVQKDRVQKQALLPGDLVYYGPPSKIRHVGLCIGNGKMLNAPTFG